ncbi:SPOR domain-containing protein [Porphyromonas sp.]|uniref:SPOR domain-containing protein n=1 Tax=Porphyromonas sp. TaxID=1924944 RepID=UPI002A760ACE|nr:SPOR domain-containing protein [Porphyromonas sp.]MDY3067351.1 SPOR domain-containing protein [Porphyromonas sp.]
MNTTLGWIVLALLLLSNSAAMAQDTKPNIFDALQQDKPGAGIILITQSPAIQELIGKRANPLDNARVVGGYAILRGYKIQVYSGNLSSSRGIASSRERQINALYPELMPTVEYDAPFWRLRVGNFIEREEAQQALEELRKAFPAFSREMYIVRSQIKVPNE